MTEAQEPPEADAPDEFDELTVVLLVRRPDAPVLTEEESDRLQRQHLGHFQQLRDLGALVACGPVEDPPEPGWRGLCIYRVGLDEARRLAESDPAVRRGRFSVSAFRWFTRKGAVQAGP